MMIRKMTAFLTAVAIIGTGAAYSGSLNSFTGTLAAQAAEQSETCGVTVSVTAFKEAIPEGVNLKLVSVKGEEQTEIASWEACEAPTKEITGLEYSEDADYRIIIKDSSAGFMFPKEARVKLSGKGSTDKIAICGYSYDLPSSDMAQIKTSLVEVEPYSVSISETDDPEIFAQADIIGEDGFRYITRSSAIALPDGHYTAVVKPAEGYRFLYKYSGSAKKVTDMDKTPPLEYFDSRDFSQPVEFDLKNGFTDTRLDFYVEKIPTEEESDSATISVVDADTGKLLTDCTVILNKSFDDFFTTMTWNTSLYNPLRIDTLVDEEVEFTAISTPPGYEPYGECKVEFEDRGEHKEGVIRLKRTMTDKELKALKQVELPAEDPVPVDDKHCAVTVAVFDYKTKAAVPQNCTATLYEYPADSSKLAASLVSWDAAAEPVKTITDIEYHKDSLYCVDVSYEGNANNDGKTYLFLKKGGDTDKIAVPLYPVEVYHSLWADCRVCTADASTSSLNDATVSPKENAVLSSGGVYDNSGFRYLFTSSVNGDLFGTGALPDGHYTLRAVPAEGYRFVSMDSETASIGMLRGSGFFKTEATYEQLTKNAENGKNGLEFTVRDGITDIHPVLFIEADPDAEKSCSASISIVDEVTGEPVEGVNAELRSRDIPANYLKWNTTDTPVKSFDYLFHTGTDYTVFVYDTPETYSDRFFGTKFSFSGYGENQDIVIKLKPAAPAAALGDTNGDAVVDANDASEILGLYAEVSTGNDISEEAKTAGDVNKDGLLDSADASLVLEYYALASTSGGIDAAEFFKERQAT